ncbi:MAG: DsbA family protein [Elusimicrobiota bacterium]
MFYRQVLICSVFMSGVLYSGCVSNSQIKNAILKNPDIVFKTIQDNPEKFMDVFTKANVDARKLAEEREKEENFKNPKNPVIESDRAIRGHINAPITIVEYSDFQCPYCKKGFETVEEIRKIYGDKVRLVFKHFPLDFHPLALPAAQYFEAIGLQSAEKAYQFYDEVFRNQGKLKEEKEKIFKKIAKELNLDMKKLEADLESQSVMTRINADKAEAKSLGISGTPGFLINGVKLSGARPIADFEEVIQRLLKTSAP